MFDQEETTPAARTPSTSTRRRSSTSHPVSLGGRAGQISHTIQVWQVPDLAQCLVWEAREPQEGRHVSRLNFACLLPVQLLPVDLKLGEVWPSNLDKEWGQSALHLHFSTERAEHDMITITWEWLQGYWRSSIDIFWCNQELLDFNTMMGYRNNVLRPTGRKYLGLKLTFSGAGKAAILRSANEENNVVDIVCCMLVLWLV